MYKQFHSFLKYIHSFYIFIGQLHVRMLNLVMNGAILYPVKQVNNVSIATHGLNNNFILKYTSQPNATIFKTPVIVRVGPSVPLRILSVSKVYVFDIELGDIEI